MVRLEAHNCINSATVSLAHVVNTDFSSAIFAIRIAGLQQ